MLIRKKRSAELYRNICRELGYTLKRMLRRLLKMKTVTAFLFLLIGLGAQAGIDPEPTPPPLEYLGDPEPSWFLAKGTLGPAYLFDSETGEMQGLLSITPWTPSIIRHPTRKELYAAEVHYSRRTRGTRNDILSIIDHSSLSGVAEIDIPDKIASLAFPQYLGLLSDSRHLTIFNMTPAQSVSVVDVLNRQFVEEISTPGCALQMPVEKRAFLMICGDGTLQRIELKKNGTEKSRSRSDEFFSVEDDPIFDKPIKVGKSWELISFEGNLFNVSMKGNNISIGEPWSIIKEGDEGWRVGGIQVMTIHEGLDLLFTIMHQGGVDTHETPGKEIWVFDRKRQTRIAKIVSDKLINSILVTQTNNPKLIASRALEPMVDIYDVRTLKKDRTILAGQNVGVLLPY